MNSKRLSDFLDLQVARPKKDGGKKSYGMMQTLGKTRPLGTQVSPLAEAVLDYLSHDSW